jgi:hypothetical protein
LSGAYLVITVGTPAAADTQALATDLAYHALNGSLPAGAGSPS